MDMDRISLPIALTIAGADTGGGAGIQADLKTFASLGVHGCSVLTCMTAQNPAEVLAVMPSSVDFLHHQLQAVFRELPPSAVKTGMLYSADLIHTAAEFLKDKSLKLVVDPVMISTSGAKLLQSDAVQVLCRELFPLASLLTPNLDEAVYLLDHPIRNRSELSDAARELYQRFGCPVLAKGGHLRDSDQAVDILWDGSRESVFSKPFINGVSTHGTGCTFSSAITAFLSRGLSLEESVGQAKEYVNRVIADSVRIGRHYALNWFGQH